MSGAVRAARVAGTAVGTRREVHVPALAVEIPRRAPRASRPGPSITSAHVSLVSPTDAATRHRVVIAAVGLVSGPSGTANAGVC
jgi:hypothetical protein